MMASSAPSDFVVVYRCHGDIGSLYENGDNLCVAFSRFIGFMVDTSHNDSK